MGGIERRTCRAVNRQGVRCGNWAMTGQEVCRLHGGSSPQALDAAKRRLEKARADGRIAEFLEEYGIEAKHPHDGILEVVDKSGAMVAVLGLLVGELSPDGGGLYGPDHLGDGRPHVLVEMYGDWLDRHAKACKLALDAGVDERRLRMAEAQASRLFSALSAALASAGLTTEQQFEIRSGLAAHLREEL